MGPTCRRLGKSLLEQSDFGEDVRDSPGERVFLALYTMELLLRFIAGGRDSLKSAWILCLGSAFRVQIVLAASFRFRR